MKPVTISVVIPAYNARTVLAETIESVLDQTHPSYEVLVIDDGSTDGTADLARQYAPDVRVISQPNRGESAARNLGLSRATGEWVAWLDSDDVWEAQKLERQSECIRLHGPDLVCVLSGFRRFGSLHDGEIVIPENVTFSPAEHIAEWRLEHPSTAVVRRASSPQFPEWTQHAEDIIYFAGLAARGRFAIVPEPLVNVRSRPQQQSRSPLHPVGSHASRLRWARECGLFSQSEIASIAGQLDAALLQRLEVEKWKREWKSYWTIRHYLTTQRPNLSGHAGLQERIAPAWAYTVKDALDRLRSRGQRASRGQRTVHG